MHGLKKQIASEATNAPTVIPQTPKKSDSRDRSLIVDNCSSPIEDDVPLSKFHSFQQLLRKISARRDGSRSTSRFVCDSIN